METYTTFEEVFRLLKEYKDEHEHCNIPENEKVGTISLGRIVNSIRTGVRKTTLEQKAMLDSIGFVWKVNESPTSFEDVFNLLKEYQEEHGHCKISREHKVGTINLGQIVDDIRQGKRKTTTEQKAMLDSIGFVWKAQESPTSFEEVFRLLVKYKDEHGHCNVPANEKVGTINLGKIVQDIRSGRRKTTNDQKVMLDSIDFVWKGRNITPFQEIFELLVEYKKEHGHCNVPKGTKVGTINLGEIVRSIRRGTKKTTTEQKAMLDSIGFVWRVRNREK